MKFLGCTAFSIAILAGAPASANDELGLRDYLQIGSRVVDDPAKDALEVKVLIAPEIRLYAMPLTFLDVQSLKPVSMIVPRAVSFRTADGQVHDVYSGTVTISASFPKGTLKCGKTIRSLLRTQGCTANLCFPPEQIPVMTATASC